MSNNSVAIFSNGITAFTRTFPVTKDKKELSIPVRKKYISDVLGSLNIFGNVTLLEPPSFTPVNANKSALQIEGDQILDSLVVGLTGAAVKVSTNDGKDFSGTLMGKQVTEEDSGSYKVTLQKLVVLTDDGMRVINLDDVKTVDFTEADIKAEIAQALQNKRQGIKPESTFVSLQLKSQDDRSTDAVIQYTVPTAAWVINYRLSNKKGKFALEAYAVVHNNTDEDWNDYIVTVVVGEPLTFESDLDEQKTPTRKRVSFVKSVADGGNTAEVGYATESFGAAADDGGEYETVARGGRSMAKSASLRSFAACAMPAMAGGGLEGGAPPKAATNLADAAEVGDFTVWTGKDAISIKSQKSALVPLFDVELSEAKPVLYYKYSQNPSRPYRAVKFKNTTEWSLGSGPCAVYQDNMSEGSCALDACKPGEERLLLHAKETGVRVLKETKRTETKITSIKVAENVATTEVVYTSVTTYTITNSKKDAFTLELDHQTNLQGAEVKSSHPVSEKLSDGSRLKVELKGKAKEKNETVVVTVTETLFDKSNTSFDTNWLRRTFVDTDNRLGDDPKLREVFTLQANLDKISRDVQVASQRVQTLTTEQGRHRENLKAFDSKSEEAGEFRTSLKKSETEIKTLSDTTIPDLTEKRDAAQKALDNAKLRLTLTWANS